MLRVRRACEGARESAANRGPEKPCGKQNSQRDFVAVEDLDQLAHEHDLAHDGGKAADDEGRTGGGLVRDIHWYGIKG